MPKRKGGKPQTEPEMEGFRSIVEKGKTLGLQGKELAQFVQKEEHEEREHEREREEREREREEREREERDKIRQHELELRRIESRENVESIRSETHVNQNSQGATPKVKLPFLDDRDDVETYLAQYEKVATISNWDRDEWGARLAPLLKGAAREAYVKLPTAEACNYTAIKEAILRRFQLNATTYRQKFRYAKRESNENAHTLWERLALLLERWIELSGKTNEDLKEMLILEKFLEALPFEQARFVRERDPQSGEDAVHSANVFEQSRQAERHKLRYNQPAVERRDRQQQPSQLPQKEKGQRPPSNEESQKNAQPQRKFQGFSLTCFTCGGPHLARNCPKRKERSAVAQAATGDSTSEKPEYSKQALCDECRNIRFEPECKAKIGKRVAKAIRDTGSTATIVDAKLVPKSCYTGKTRDVTFANASSHQSLPTAKVNIQSPYFTGKMEVLVMENPLYPIIIGNQRKDERSQEKSIPVFPIDQTLATSDKHRAKVMLSDVTPKTLSEEQIKDESLAKLRKFADEKAPNKPTRAGKISHVIKIKDIYYREFTTPDLQYRQVLVPRRYRNEVLRVAHDTPMAGHAGMRKTLDRIWKDFYWPGIQQDVRRYCLSCDICQRCINKSAVRKAPLQKMPLIDMPFKRVAVDLVGPMQPPSARGHKYILTMVDYATRYAEAVPLKKATSETIAEALWEMWTRLGIPQEILTDRGSQFLSQTMQQVNDLLNIKGITTTPYHAQTNGLVERFNGTLKTMLKKLSTEQPHDWDKFIPALLFAYREAPQESLKFSPFELLYGRHVRGPLQILKQCWTDEMADPEVVTTAQYVTELQHRIEETCKIAQENLAKASARTTELFNRKAKLRNLVAGQKVLLLLPLKHNKLQLNWKGPYVITRRVNRVNYKVEVDGKEKTFHVNVLKEYHERGEEVATVVVEEEKRVEENMGYIPLIPLVETEGYQDVKCNVDLDNNKLEELQKVIESHAVVLTDLPGDTRLTTCNVKTVDERPVKVQQYPIPHSQLDTVKKEVEEMLRMGVIERANSPYNAPLVLVKKKDGGTRFCVDYRKLNQITEFDAEPLPDIETLFAKVSRAKYFSKMDLSKGFWQIPMNEKDKAKTAFSTPQGQFQWKKMPFGMKNASAVFSRMMRSLLDPLNREDVHNFVDDILISSETWEQHVESLDIVLTRLKEAGLTARPVKCYFGFEQISFLGHEVGHGKICPEMDKIQKLRDSRRPTTKKQLRSFLGLAGYYRKFVPNFAAVAAPLTDLTKKGTPEHLPWTDACENAMNALKAHLTCRPVMCLPNREKQYVLRTDASNQGLGAVLLQEEEGVLKPVAYASKRLNAAERNYSTIEKECLAVVWGIGKFRVYLYGTHFVLETDHQPLQFLRRAKTENSRLMRWAIMLQDHSFTVRVIPGKDNVGADFMSRSDTESEEA